MGWMEVFWEFISLETTTHPWVWWSLRMGRRLWDHKLFHLRFQAILYSSEVLATLLLCDRGLLEGLLYKVVIVFVVIIIIWAVVE